MQPTAHEAVQAALICDWMRAIKLNQELLETDPDDLGARLRIANALLEVGKQKEALKHAKRAYELDSSSSLAKKCVERCSSSKFIPKQTTSANKVNLKAFLETPGKTHLVRLVHLGEPKIIAQLHPGASLNLEIAAHKVAVETTDGVHVGHLPDDIVSRVTGNKTGKFWAAVKNVKPTEVTILLHER